MTVKQQYLMGVDLGTSNCKATLINEKGEVVAGGQTEYTTVFPRSSWAEQDPEQWYKALVQTIRSCVASSKVSARDISAISVCGPAHSAVLLDSDGQAVRSVILWSDRRSTAQANWLHEHYSELIFDTTFQPVNPSWTLSQLMWIRQNQPDVWPRIHRIMLGKDYLAYRLTGSWHTDWYDALGTQLFDARRRVWSEDLCGILGLPVETLPPVRDATAVSGKVTPDAAKETGLMAGTPVVVGSGDSAVEALGAGVVRPGQCIAKLATSGTVNVVSAAPHPDWRTMTYYHVIPGLWCTIAATNSGAAAARWFGEAFNLGGEGTETLVELDRIASGVAPGSDGLLFHPYLQGERSPYWDPELRGDFVGITVQHHLGHFARAVLEGVALSLRDCLELVKEMNLPITEVRALGGGTRSEVWVQILAEVLGTELLVPESETASFGAAVIAGMASGVFSGSDDPGRWGSRVSRTIVPCEKNAEVYDEMYGIYKSVGRSLVPAMHALGQLSVHSQEQGQAG